MKITDQLHSRAAQYMNESAVLLEKARRTEVPDMQMDFSMRATEKSSKAAGLLESIEIIYLNASKYEGIAQ